MIYFYSRFSCLKNQPLCLGLEFPIAGASINSHRWVLFIKIETELPYRYSHSKCDGQLVHYGDLILRLTRPVNVLFCFENIELF